MKIENNTGSNVKYEHDVKYQKNYLKFSDVKYLKNYLKFSDLKFAGV
jgi:hypothetical protein